MQDLTRFRLALAALANAALRGPVDASLAMEVHDAARVFAQELQQYREADRMRQLGEQIARLESMMRDRDAGERRDIIMRRLGLTRRTFYRVRQCHGNGTSRVSDPSKQQAQCAEGP